jgi:drug/metabolite transporter (DMT)-like permease
MTPIPSQRRLRAAQMLILANVGWGLSFPTMKAIALLQQPLLPHSSSWFVASSTLALRFALATLIMALVCLRTLRGLTRLEIWEGVGLGLFASVGLIFQMDGLTYTSASTSAFLTQFYCLTIPVWVACREGRWPSGRTVAGCLLVIVGVSVLSEFDWRQLRLGRGECETLIGSIIFTGQILWLQRPRFARNNVNRFTLVMFAVITVVAVPVAWATGSAEDHWVQAWASGPALAAVLILSGFCTLGAYLLMNYWQPLLSATQAGLIYCLEPVFASLFALFLPAWFSNWYGIQYANEQIGWSLLVGGGLITVANVLVQTASPATTPPAPERGAATAGP